ncbi:MAG: tripartite tricarboxylate transporter substrate binding protein [Pseudomonadota bacterium]
MIRARLRFSCLAAALLAAAVLAPATAAAQAAWPTRPITFVVTYAAGGGADLIGRLLASKMGPLLGQPVIVENRPGGGAGQIGAAYVARSAPDGYTVMVDAGGFAINPGLYEKLPYHPERDFTAIGVAALFPHVLVVTPSLEVKSASDVVALARKKELFYASSGQGSSQHIAAMLFQQSTGVKMTHVPYKGGGPAMVDVMAGQVPVFFGNAASTLPIIQGGKLRALGVAGKKRIAALPDVPTMEEQGIKGTEIYEWNGVFVPSATPKAVVDRLADALDKTLAQPEVRDKILALGGEMFQGDRQQATAFIASETRRMGQVIKANNIKPNE